MHDHYVPYEMLQRGRCRRAPGPHRPSYRADADEWHGDARYAGRASHSLGSEQERMVEFR